MTNFTVKMIVAFAILVLIVIFFVKLGYGYTKPPYESFIISECAYAQSESVLIKMYSYLDGKPFDAEFERLYNNNVVGFTKPGTKVIVTAIGKGAPKYRLLATVRIREIENKFHVWTSAVCVH